MDLVMILLVIAIIGFLTWLIITYIPMPAPFPTVIILVAIVFIIFYLLKRLGGLPNVL